MTTRENVSSPGNVQATAHSPSWLNCVSRPARSATLKSMVAGDAPASSRISENPGLRT